MKINRDKLGRQIDDAAARLVAALVEVIGDQMDGQLEAALEVARSALASDMEVSWRTQPACIRPTDEPSSSSTAPTSAAARSASAATATIPRPSATAAASSRTSTAPARSSASVTSTGARTASGAEPRSPPGRRTNTCGKCGAPGFTSRTCGVTHNLSTGPATIAASPPCASVDPAPVPSPSRRAVTSLPRRMTPAELAAAKAKILERRARDEARLAEAAAKRAAAAPPPPPEPVDPVEIVAGLPTPIATFTI